MSGDTPPGRFRIPIRSRRRRRRLFWATALAVVAGSIAAIIVLVGNTGKEFSEVTSNRPPQVYRSPPPHTLTLAERKEVRGVTLAFIGTAVARRHLEQSYDLASPNLREGLTRKQWRTGNIPVVPYRVQSVIHWSLQYSFPNDVAYEVALAGKPGTLPSGKTFFIELKRFPHVQQGHWVVESWGPSGISSDTPREVRRSQAPPPPVEARLSAAWLLVPIGVLVVAIAVPLFFFGRHWHHARRTRRALGRS